MRNNYLRKDIKNQTSRRIYSRRNNVLIDKKYFNFLRERYFINIDFKKKINSIKPNKDDKKMLIYIFRSYYNMFVEVKNDIIILHTNFPKKFKIKHEVNSINHPHSPKTFTKGTIMIFQNDIYSLCNWQKGIPLRKKYSRRLIGKITPYCQINYNFIEVID